MNNVILFIFSVTIFIFGVFTILGMLNKNDYKYSELNVKKEIDMDSFHINKYCKDPFQPNQYSIEHTKGYEIFTRENTICYKRNSSNLYCRKVECNLTNNIVLNSKAITYEYLCKLNRINNNVNLNCSIR